MNDLEEYERDCLQREAEELRAEAEAEAEDLNETSELMDCIRKLSSAQSRLRFLVVQLLETQEGECAQEVLDLTTHVRNHIQNNFQKLRIGLDT